MRKSTKVLLVIIGICLIVLIILQIFFSGQTAEPVNAEVQTTAGTAGGNLIKDDSYVWPELTVDLLDINPYSRPGTALSAVNNIVIHYVANPGSSAKANRDYFNGLATSHLTSASAHMVVGLEGEIVQCIPLNEVAYASNDRNNDTIAIEVCHPEADGKFSPTTYDTLTNLCAWLCLRYGLPADALIRHYDVTGKNCPKYYVEHEDAWEQLKSDVAAKMQNYPKQNAPVG